MDDDDVDDECDDDNDDDDDDADEFYLQICTLRLPRQQTQLLRS